MSHLADDGEEVGGLRSRSTKMPFGADETSYIMCDKVTGLRVAVGVLVHIGYNLNRGHPGSLPPVLGFSTTMA